MPALISRINATAPLSRILQHFVGRVTHTYGQKVTENKEITKWTHHRLQIVVNQNLALTIEAKINGGERLEITVFQVTFSGESYSAPQKRQEFLITQKEVARAEQEANRIVEEVTKLITTLSS